MQERAPGIIEHDMPMPKTM